MNDLDKTDPTFIEDLRASDEAVQAVAEHLRLTGYGVTLPPVFERPSADQAADYADGGDLVVNIPMEVKRRMAIDFTNRADFPFPTIIVDQRRDFDRKHPKPDRYWIVNKSLTVAAVVSVRATAKHWKVVHRHNGKTNRASEYYEVGMEHVEFRKLLKGEARQ